MTAAYESFFDYRFKYLCRACGAIVGDQEAHTSFHKGLRDLLTGMADK